MQQTTAKHARQRQRERAAQAARHRVWRRRLTILGALGLAMVGGLLGGLWLLGDGDNGSGTSTALYSFETQDFHSLAFDPDDADTIFFGHHGGLMVSNDGGARWEDSTLDSVDAMQLALPVVGNDATRLAMMSFIAAMTVVQPGRHTRRICRGSTCIRLLEARAIRIACMRSRLALVCTRARTVVRSGRQRRCLRWLRLSRRRSRWSRVNQRRSCWRGLARSRPVGMPG